MLRSRLLAALCIGTYIVAESIKEIDRLIGKFFQSFDNRNGCICSFNTFKSHFVEGAKIGNRTSECLNIWSLLDFWAPREKLLSGGGLCDFHEWETDSNTSIINGLAFRQSFYEKDGMFDNSPYKGTGVKFFQLALISKGWRITHLLWEDY